MAPLAAATMSSTSSGAGAGVGGAGGGGAAAGLFGLLDGSRVVALDGHQAQARCILMHYDACSRVHVRVSCKGLVACVVSVMCAQSVVREGLASGIWYFVSLWCTRQKSV